MAKDEFPVISQKKLKAAREYFAKQVWIKNARVTLNNPLQIVIDSNEPVDPQGTKSIVREVLVGMGFRDRINDLPDEGDYLAYCFKGKHYLAHVIYSHGADDDPGIGAAVYWEKKLTKKELKFGNLEKLTDEPD